MNIGFYRRTLKAGLNVPDIFDAVFGKALSAIWLDDHGERGSGFSYLLDAEPLVLTTAWRNEVRKAWREIALAKDARSENLPFGIFFVVPYETDTENIRPLDPRRGAPIPIALAIRRLLEINHQTGEVSACGLSDARSLTDWANQCEALILNHQPRVEEVSSVNPVLHWRDSKNRYLEMIGLAQEFIRNGDVYQLCLTTSLETFTPINPIALHQTLREKHPTHHQAMIRLGETSIVSASPETFISLTREGQLVTRPIKGTRPRGSNNSADLLLREELLSSDKERAENLMSVDLMRNDLSRVCEVGSLHVPDLLVVESYSTVHQLVSTVSGKLRKELDLVDVLDAIFPAGSMTGAPKRRAVQLLIDLEQNSRGLYSGTFGIWRADGSAEFAMTIRTAIVRPDRFSLGVGGGITALSNPEEEVLEVAMKANAFGMALNSGQVSYS